MTLKNIYKNKTVLITGHTGFKGSWLTAWLLHLGAKVIGVSNEVPTSPSLFDSANLNKFIRDEIKFSSIEELIQQISKDIEDINKN